MRESDRSQSLASERRERLEYLADLLSELQVLAEREGCEKLADLIALSRAEALEESLSGRPLASLPAFQRHETMTLTLDAARKVKLQKCDLNVLHAEAGGAGERIDGHRRRSQGRQNSVHLSSTGSGAARWRLAARFVRCRIDGQAVVGAVLLASP